MSTVGHGRKYLKMNITSNNIASRSLPYVLCFHHFFFFNASDSRKKFLKKKTVISSSKYENNFTLAFQTGINKFVETADDEADTTVISFHFILFLGKSDV